MNPITQFNALTISAPSSSFSSSPSSPSPPVPTRYKRQINSLKFFSQIPPGSIVHLKAFDKIYEGEYHLIRVGQGQQVTPFDSVRLNTPIEISSRVPISQNLSFNVAQVQDIRVLRNQTIRGGFHHGSPIISIRAPQIRNRPKLPTPTPTPCGTEVKTIMKRRDSPNVTSESHSRSVRTDRLGAKDSVMNTFVVRYDNELKSLLTTLEEEEVVACSLEGQNVGRDGQVAWVILNTKGTLIPVDIIGLLHQTPNLWDILKTHIFSRESLVKIFHDCRPAADYLFHCHGVTLKNVFDTQVADVNVQRDTTGVVPACYKALSATLALYIPQIHVGEVNFLQKYECLDFKTDSPWMLKPLPPQDILQLGVLKVKYLLMLRNILAKRMLVRFYTCVDAHMDVMHSENSNYFIENPTEIPNLVEAILMIDEEGN